MSNSDTATLVVRTGSFANWITAAAAVGTFVVVVKTAKKVIDILSSKDDEDIVAENEEALERELDEEPITSSRQGPNPPKFNYNYKGPRKFNYNYKGPQKHVPEDKTIGEKVASKVGRVVGKQVSKAILHHAYKGTIFEKQKPKSKFIQNIRKFF